MNDEDIKTLNECFEDEVKFKEHWLNRTKGFGIHETTNSDCEIKRLCKPFVNQRINIKPCSEFDSELLQRQLQRPAEATPNEANHTDRFVSVIYATNDSLKEELKEMINKQFGKDGYIEK